MIPEDYNEDYFPLRSGNQNFDNSSNDWNPVSVNSCNCLKRNIKTYVIKDSNKQRSHQTGRNTNKLRVT